MRPSTFESQHPDACAIARCASGPIEGLEQQLPREVQETKKHVQRIARDP
jgi:hypothetical protein